MRGYAYTSEDEEFHDPEFREEYFKRGGIYDVQCPTCKGKNVVLVVGEDILNEKQKADYALYQEWKEERDQADAEYEAECRMERMMGC
jgi:predicted methyltransferase